MGRAQSVRGRVWWVASHRYAGTVPFVIQPLIPEERLAYQEHAEPHCARRCTFFGTRLGSDVVVRRWDEEVGIYREPCRCEVVEGCFRTAASGVEDADAWR